jgi:hypothetical protein
MNASFPPPDLHTFAPLIAIRHGQVDPHSPLSEQLDIASRQQAARIEAGNLRRLPQAELVEQRGLAMFLDAAADHARRLEGENAVLRAKLERHRGVIQSIREWWK